MAYRLEKNGDDYDIVWDGFEKGIAPSPHKGIANMQGVDISTETKEVMLSYARVQQSQQTISTGTFTQIDGSHLQTSATTPLNSLPVAGSWVHIVSSTITNLSAGTNYFVYSSNQSTGVVQLATAYTPSGSIITTFGSGSATFTSAFNMGGGIQAATEFYTDSSFVAQNRYYILDSNGRLWCYDTALTSLWNWFLPYTTVITSDPQGVGVINGVVFVFGGNQIYTVSTVQLANGPSAFVYAYAMTGLTGSTYPHRALTSHQGRMYWPDGKFVGSIFPNITLDASAPPVNIQSYCQYTSSSTTGTITAILSGSVPATQTYGSTVRIPAFFLCAPGGALPSALTSGTKYYIDYTPGLSTSGQFEVYAASSGGSALDISTGKSGTQYFNTFFTQSSDGATTFEFNQSRLNLPNFETATCLAELDNLVIVGTKSNILYTWNQIDTLPTDLVALPESNTVNLITVNNNVVSFTGNTGQVYITNGSTSDRLVKVPDYCSGLIQPYFVWGGAMFLRGRVWFSIQDQTASHTGNCGGIWSFDPTSIEENKQLRMDNRPLDGTFNGMSPVLLPAQNQAAQSPQYWDVRTSSISNPTYTINFTDTIPSTSTPAIIQLDIVPTGTLLKKKTFEQIEFKLATPTDPNATETVALAWRQNLTDSFTSAGTTIKESSTGYISGYVPVNFQNTQWTQLQVTLTPSGTTGTTFMRLFEVRLH